MPGFGETPDEGVGGGRSASTSSGPVQAAYAVEHVAAILTTAAGTVAASATQVLASPHMDRRRVTITNSDATAGQYLYVAHDSSVSATRYRVRLDAGQSVSLDIGPGVDIYLFGDVANTNYTVHEESVAVG